jgi:hypothetical protein
VNPLLERAEADALPDELEAVAQDRERDQVVVEVLKPADVIVGGDAESVIRVGADHRCGSSQGRPEPADRGHDLIGYRSLLGH